MPIKQTTLNGEPLNGPICFPSSFVRRVSSTLPFSLPRLSLSPVYLSLFRIPGKRTSPTERGKHRPKTWDFPRNYRSLSLSLWSRPLGEDHSQVSRGATRNSRKDIELSRTGKEKRAGEASGAEVVEVGGEWRKEKRYSSDCATPWRSHGGRLDSYCILGKINWYGDSRGWMEHAARLNRVSETGMRGTVINRLHRVNRKPTLVLSHSVSLRSLPVSLVRSLVSSPPPLSLSNSHWVIESLSLLNSARCCRWTHSFGCWRNDVITGSTVSLARFMKPVHFLRTGTTGNLPPMCRPTSTSTRAF